MAEGAMEPAHQAYDRGLAIFREIGSHSGAAGSLARPGHAAQGQGQTVAALTAYVEALQLAQDSQALRPALDALRGLAELVAGEQPGQALLAAQVVAGHPATDENSRRAARRLLDQMNAGEGDGAAQEFSPEDAAARLGEVTQALLAALPARRPASQK